MKKIILSVIAALAIGQAHSQMLCNWSGRVGDVTGDKGISCALVEDNLIFSTGIFQGTGYFNFGTGGIMISDPTTYDMYITDHSSSGGLLWRKEISGTGAEYPHCIIASPGGNDIYVCGQYRGTTDFNYPAGGTSVHSSAGGSDDIFIARYNGTTGAMVWCQVIGLSNSTDIAYGLCFDNTGNLLVCGCFAGLNVNFNPGGTPVLLSSTGGTQDAFYGRFLASNGTCTWVNSIGSSGMDIAFGVCRGPGSNLLLCGTFGGSADFDPVGTFTMAPTGSNDYFVCRYPYTTGGATFGWAKASGTPAFDQAKDVAFYGNAAYITGDIGPGLWSFGTGSYTNAGTGTSDLYLAAYDIVTGANMWGLGFPEPLGTDGGENIATDDNGYIYVTGVYENTMSFDPIGGNPLANVASAGLNDAFLLRYSSGPVFKTVDSFGGSGMDDCFGLDVHHNLRKLYITGGFTGTVNFNPNGSAMNWTSAGQTDIFLAKYNWTAPLRMPGPSSGNAASVSRYPNPTSGKFFIDNLEENSIVELYSLNGEKLQSWNADGTEQLVTDLDNYADGIYLLKITNADGTATTDKIILQR